MWRELYGVCGFDCDWGVHVCFCVELYSMFLIRRGVGWGYVVILLVRVLYLLICVRILRWVLV